MTAKYWQAGEVLDYTPSDNAVANGEVVSLGTRIGVAGADIAKGATGPLYVEGVFYMDKASGAVTMGAALYYDVANKKITTVASTGESSAKVDNIPAGYAAAAAACMKQATLFPQTMIAWSMRGSQRKAQSSLTPKRPLNAQIRR